jgi:site-specific DNA-methyltransferase (cytosine-N4-specific)
MVQPYYQDESITLHHGKALDVAPTLKPGSAACIVTSPPYWNLRDYGTEGQYGLERTPAEYVENLRALFGSLRPALADEGTLWLNIGDSYGKGKQLMGMPWRVALALQDDGWILRNAVVWHKPNAMPESVRDRLRGTYEQVFLFAKNRKYSFGLDEIREPHNPVSIARAGRSRKTAYAPDGQTPGKRKETAPNPLGANPGDVWSIPTKPFKEAHSAVMPPELARRCILAGSRPGDTVLDPFSGSGTTGMVARDEGRGYVGIDISATYLDLSLSTRLRIDPMELGAIA